MGTSKPGTRITPTDIEEKLKAFQGEVQDKVEDQRTNMMIAVGVVSFLLILAFYFLGRRSGKKRSTLVEIRRV